jgi:hypothetical protein
MLKSMSLMAATETTSLASTADQTIYGFPARRKKAASRWEPRNPSRKEMKGERG